MRGTKVYIFIILAFLLSGTAHADEIVGRIAGSGQVTQNGQFSYEIPIAAVSGTGGMSPQLSVCYNSANGNGLFGQGFDLSGISMITRSPRNLFRDGKADIIHFDGNDRFSLDGVRLTLVSSETDRREYRTESNSFFRIVAEGDIAEPTKFTVYTKAGTIHEYLQAKAMLGSSGKNIYWLESKVSDTKGNYYTVKYGGSAYLNEFYPVRIDYTGNDGASLTPYASVRFTYLTVTGTTSYIYGERACRRHVIKSVASYYKDQKVREYTFDYSTVSNRHYISQVTESAGGDKKRPTVFTWDNKEDINMTSASPCYAITPGNQYYVTGDFNGDGKADILAKTFSETDMTFKLLLSDGKGFRLSQSGTFIIPPDEKSEKKRVMKIKSGDFNGDGYDDIVVERGKRPFYSIDLYLSHVDLYGNASLEFEKRIVPAFTFDHALEVMDINHDGAADLVVRGTVASTDYYAFVSASTEGGVSPLASEEVSKDLPDGRSWMWNTLRLDLDGDGTDEFFSYEDRYRLDLYKLSDGCDLEYIRSCSFSSNYFFTGDFNGDGKADIITVESDDKPAEGWTMNFSTGALHSQDGWFQSVNMTGLFNPKDKNAYVADINGDGYDDLLVIDKKTSNNRKTTADIYINDRSGTGFTHYTGPEMYGSDKRSLCLADFTGNGKLDFIAYSKFKDSTPELSLYTTEDNTTGLLTSVTDGYGSTTTVTYGRLTDGSLLTRDGTFSYPTISVLCPWAAVSAISAPDGTGGRNTVEYTYSDLLMHKRGRGVLGFGKVTSKDLTTGIKTENTYETVKLEMVPCLKRTVTSLNGRVLNETAYTNSLAYQYQNRKNGVVYTCVPTSVSTHGYEYNSGTLVNEKSVEYEYDSYGNATRTVERNGRNTVTTVNRYTNDEEKWHLGRLTDSEVTKTDGTVSVTRHSCFEYDTASGLLVKERFEPGDNMGYGKTYWHDIYGNITRSVTEANDDRYDLRRIQTEYTGDGRFVKSSTNSMDHTTVSETDPAIGVEKTNTDINGLKTSFSHDGFGNVTEIVTPLETTRQTVSWAAGGNGDAPDNAVYCVKTEKTGMPDTWEFFDCLDRKLRTVTVARNGEKVYADTEYDSTGKIRRTSLPCFKGDEAKWNTMYYDEAGRPLYDEKANGYVTAYEYDGFTVTATDTDGRSSSKTSDINGNMVKSTDALGNSVSYKYDVNGKCTEVAGPRTTTFLEYDRFGNRTRMTDPDLGTIEYKYSPFGEVVEQKGPEGTTTFEYDQLGRIVEEKRPDFTYSMVYDMTWLGAVTREECSNGSSRTFYYDGFGRPSKETEVIEGCSFTTLTSYNAMNKVDVTTYPSGFSVKNNYSADGYLTSVTRASDGKTVWKAGETNAAGQMLSETFGEKGVVSNRYDIFGKLLRTYLPGGFDKSYGYSERNLLTERTDNMRSMTEHFEHDALNRLTRAHDDRGHDQRLEYDAVGNITFKTGLGSISYHDTSNRIKSISCGTYTLPDVTDIRYTSFNKITSMMHDMSTDIDLIYDGLTLLYGADKTRNYERIVRCHCRKFCGQQQNTVKVLKTKYYVGSLYEKEIRDGRTREIDYIYADGRNVAIHESSDKDGEKFLYLHRDHIGSVMAYTDDGGNLVEETSYDAWGRKRDPETWNAYGFSNDSISEYDNGFTGHEHIDMFDMVNMDGRMYDPILGRFMTPDPFVQMPDFTQSLNRYSYCMNNPLSLTDPTGYSWLGDTFATVVGIAVSLETIGISALGNYAIIASGALGSASSALLSSVFNGANFFLTAKNTLSGAFWGAASSIINFDIGTIEGALEKIALHSVSEGAMEAMRGGQFVHGAMMGIVSSASAQTLDEYSYYISAPGRVAINAAVGGIVSEIGGGKFLNGAMTSAYVMLFNELQHMGPTYKQLEEIMEAYNNSKDKYSTPESLYNSLGGEISNAAQENPGYFKNACAARLSKALNDTGINIPYIKGQTMKGANGKNYFLRASDMKNFFQKKWGVARTISKYLKIKNGIVYQSGFQGVTGHVDVFYNEISGGSAYRYYSDKKNYPNIQTILWKYGK